MADDQQTSARPGGRGLLIASVFLSALLLGLLTLMGGINWRDPAALIPLGVVVLAGAGVWALWRSGRPRLAWALLLGGPGLLLIGFIAFFVLFAMGIS